MLLAKAAKVFGVLRLYAQSNTWFSNEQDLKGQIQLGQYADLGCNCWAT